MSEAEVWSAIAVMVFATAITRCSFLLIGPRLTLPPRVLEMLRFAPACALAAIVAPDLLLAEGQVHLDLDNLKLLAGGAAAVYYLIRRNMLETIVFGMLIFTGLRLNHVF